MDSGPGTDVANKRRRIGSGTGPAELPPQTFASPQNGLQITVNGEAFTHQPTIHHASPSRALSDSFVRTVVSNARDALHLFFEAAELNMQSDAGGFDPPTSQELHKDTLSGWSPYHSEVTRNMQLYAEIADNCPPMMKLPLVKQQKWLKPCDVVAYVGLYNHSLSTLTKSSFFRNLAPFTPIVDNYFADLSKLEEFIMKEPMLFCAVITILTRYHILSHIRANTQRYHRHERLWRHTQLCVDRLIWRMEVSRTRTIGTIEGHFRPDGVGWDSRLSLSEEEEEGDPQTRSRKRQGTFHFVWSDGSEKVG